MINSDMEIKNLVQEETDVVMLLQKENESLLNKLQELEKRWEYTIESNGRKFKAK
jgi:DNA-directed RNA polymerase subunit L